MVMGVRSDRIIGTLLLVLIVLVGVASLLLGTIFLVSTWVASGPLLIKIKCSVFCVLLIVIGLWAFACIVNWHDRNML